MTVLVLGDSFAAPMGRDGIWVDHFSDITGETVENYAEGGTGPEYSYDHFLNNYEVGKYSTVIFLMSYHNRHFIKNGDEGNFIFHADCKDSVEQMSKLKNKGPYWKKELVTNDVKLLKSLEIANAYYPEWSLWKKRAISDSLKYTVKEKLLILDCEEELMPIQQLDFKNLNMKFDPDMETRKRPNHFSMKQSLEFAQYIVKHLQGELDMKDVISNPKKYFTISTTKEEAGLK